MGELVSVNVSKKKGGRKKRVERLRVRSDHGLVGDAHAGRWHRQVSLLAQESIDGMAERGLDLSPGDFGENLTTRGLELFSIDPGTRIRVGDEVVLEVSQIGKDCERPCAIYRRAGDCVMPREGIFALVIEGGTVSVGDDVVVES